MYKAYEFTFAGIPASAFGMFISDIGNKKHGDNVFGNQANVVETRIANRIKPLHFGVRYNDNPLEFSLIFGAEYEMDRYQLQEVAQWLTGYQEYQWLTIDQPDMEKVQFRCLIKSLTPISVGWIPYAFEAKILCDSPYAYSYPFEEVIEVNGTTEHRFYNDSTVRERLCPQIKIELSEDCTNFYITNNDTKEVMSFANLPTGGMTILIDNENQVVREEGGRYNLYPYFNFQFFELVSGDNNLTFEGIGKVTISGQFLYNIGA